MVRLAMWSSPLLVILIFTLVMRTTVSASSTMPNRTHPLRSPRANTALMQDLLGPDSGKRTLRAMCFNDRYLMEVDGYVVAAHWTRSPGQYWYIEQINDNEVALKSKNGVYISHSHFGWAGAAYEANEWEMLTPVKNNDDSWSFKSRWNKWMSAHRLDVYITFEAKIGRCEQWLLESW